MKDLTVSQAKVIVGEMLDRLDSDLINEQLSSVRAECGNDMVLYTQRVFPLVMNVQSEVIARHGFVGQQGNLEFVHTVKTLEQSDSQLADMNTQIKEYFLPALIETNN